jgi:anti-sigma regulatory factor (Ser/Thr protein kinase)
MTALPVQQQATMFITDPRDPDRACERLSLPAEPAAVHTARRFTAAPLDKWGVGPLIDDCALVVSELTTNAIRALEEACREDARATAGGPSPVIWLQLRLTARRLLCEVWDPLDQPPAPAQADLLAESGRGLLLVATLADAWAFYPSPVGGKAVIAWWELMT